MHQIWELQQMQSLPLAAKVVMTQQRIREWYEHWDGMVYVSFSGGKDSMLLAKLMQEVKRHGKMDFELKFLAMDPGYSEKNRQKMLDNAEMLGTSPGSSRI